MSGFIIASVLSLAANLIVIHFWGRTGMGVFIQAFAIYILATQIGVLGTQNATLTFLGRQHHNTTKLSSGIVLAALLLSLTSSVFIAIVIWLIAPMAADILQSISLENTLRAFLPAVVFGSLIKVTMAALNGASLLRRYAFFQSFRGVATFLTIVIAGLTGAEIETLPYYIGAAEALSLVLSFGLLLPLFRQSSPKRFGRWLAPLTGFGLKTLPYGLMAELNTKVDVLVLGFFVSDEIVGVYAFAALLAEGFANLIIVFRVVFSPKIVRFLSDRRHGEVASLFAGWRWKLYGLFLSTGVAASLTLWFVLPVLPLDVPSNPVVLYFSVIVAGVILASAHMPFNTVLMLGGKPGLHSLYFLFILAVNAVGNIILTPILGALGTAIATGLSYAVAALLLIYLAWRQLNVRLW
jgi:O-antigen/teichoic acid export membrane protein